VGQQNLRDFNILRGHGLLDPGQIPARIDDRALLGPAAPDHRAVLPERRDRHDHGFQGGLGHGGLGISACSNSKKAAKDCYQKYRRLTSRAPKCARIATG
jgi:hypothetical protein